MLGKKPRLNPLQSRKQLLIAESEINRAEMEEEWLDVCHEARTLIDGVKSVTSLASAAGLLGAGISMFKKSRSGLTRSKFSWLQTGLRVAQVAGSLWLGFRAKQR